MHVFPMRTHTHTHSKGRFYQIEMLSPATGKPHSPLSIRQQLEKIVAMAPGEHRSDLETTPKFCFFVERRDETGVQNLTSLPRTRWAKVRATMTTNPVNRRSLHAIDSAYSFLVLEDASPQEDVSVGVVVKFSCVKPGT